MNLFPTTTVAKTPRQNKAICETTIQAEKDLIQKIFSSFSFSDLFKEDVSELYNQVCSKCAVHSWKHSTTRIALILCCFVVVSEHLKEVIPLKRILKTTNVKIRSIYNFKKMVSEMYLKMKKK